MMSIQFLKIPCLKWNTRSVILALMLWVMCSVAFAQNRYCVFKKSGNPLVNGISPLEKGSELGVKDTLRLNNNDYVLLVNEFGSLFEIKTPNTYPNLLVKNFEIRNTEQSFTKKYFAYVWKEFTNQNKIKKEAGVVYREDLGTILLSPKDSVKTHAPQILFSWQNRQKAESNYFFLKEVKTNQITKIGLTGTSILLYLDNMLLKPEHKYQWSVTSNPFPDLTKLQYNLLDIVSKKEYEDLKKDMDVLIKYLQLLGFTQDGIQEALCIGYKYCVSI